jgi:hypothetical protein
MSWMFCGCEAKGGLEDGCQDSGLSDLVDEDANYRGKKTQEQRE